MEIVSPPSGDTRGMVVVRDLADPSVRVALVREAKDLA